MLVAVAIILYPVVYSKPWMEKRLIAAM